MTSGQCESDSLFLTFPAHQRSVNLWTIFTLQWHKNSSQACVVLWALSDSLNSSWSSKIIRASERITQKNNLCSPDAERSVKLWLNGTTEEQSKPSHISVCLNLLRSGKTAAKHENTSWGYKMRPHIMRVFVCKSNLKPSLRALWEKRGWIWMESFLD